MKHLLTGLLLVSGVVLGLASPGCGTPDVPELCRTVADNCSETDYSECLNDGQQVEQRAKERDCEDELEDYLGCVDDAVCEWRSECVVEREDLDFCVDGLPP